MIMDLTQLQVELRSIENHISVLHLEIEKMKPRSDEEKNTDFDSISRLALKHPINNAELANALDEMQKSYIYSLSYILQLEDSNRYSKLLYLCRIAASCPIELSAKDIYHKGLLFDSEDMDRMCIELSDLRYPFLLDAMVIANLSKECTERTFSIIADIAELMGCGKEEIRVIAIIAKSVLLSNSHILDEIPVPSSNWLSGKFKQYITYDWILNHRVLCGKILLEKHKKQESSNSSVLNSFMTALSPQEKKILKDLNVLTNTGETVVPFYSPIIKLQLPNGTTVRKGDVIIEYTQEVLTEKEEGKLSQSLFFNNSTRIKREKDSEIKAYRITAPCDGVLYLFEHYKKSKNGNQGDKYLVIYVASYFDEYQDIYHSYTNQNINYGG